MRQSFGDVHINRIESVQKKCIPYLFKKYGYYNVIKFAPYLFKCSFLNIEQFTDRSRNAKLLFVFDILCCACLMRFTTFLILCSRVMFLRMKSVTFLINIWMRKQSNASLCVLFAHYFCVDLLMCVLKFLFELKLTCLINI